MTVITKYTRLYMASENPTFYYDQACAELFPQYDHPNKQKLREAHDYFEASGQAVDPKERPAECEPLNDAQQELATAVGMAIEEYFRSASPPSSAIYLYLACESLDREHGYDLNSAGNINGFTALMERGRGIYDFIANKQIDQTHIDPRFAVIRLAADCKRHGLRSLRMPAGGVEVMYSLNPIQHYEAFDNQKFIPAIGGYYGIVSKPGARD